MVPISGTTEHRDAILRSVELAAHDAVLVEGAPDRLRDRPQRAVGVEVLPYGASGGEDAWVLAGNGVRALARAKFVGHRGGLVRHAGRGGCGGAEELVLEGLC